MSREKKVSREKRIYRVTLAGGLINTLLVVFKFLAGILGGSAAMIADAVHSLSDFLTDLVVLAFVKLSSKPQDKGHDYGHGKFETLATVIIGLALLVVGGMIFYKSLLRILSFLRGETLPAPGMIALVAAIISIVLKEWCYRFTIKVGKEENSQAVIANARHHRSDAMSSIATMVGIGGAILLGQKWTVLDPLAALIVSFFIFRIALNLVRNAGEDLLEQSLPEEIENEIIKIAENEPGVSEVHNLRTRRIGNRYAIEMHVRMQGSITLYESHLRATRIEDRLREEFGPQSHIAIHTEPLKVNGEYREPGA